VLWFFVTEIRNLLNCAKARPKARSKKSSFTFCRGQRPKHAIRVPRPIIGVSLVVQANVKVTVKRLDYYIERTNRERSFGSNR